MNLMVRARCKAWLHIMQFWIRLDMQGVSRHRIWRQYRFFGFDTQRVFCECGKEFH